MNVNAGQINYAPGVTIAADQERHLSTTELDQRSEMQDELPNSRLANFLSDDVAPRDRDLDTLMKGQDPLPVPLDEAITLPTQVTETDQSVPAPLRSDDQIVTGSPVEAAVKSLLDQSAQNGAEDARQDDHYSGASAGAYALEMYTGVQDVMTRLAA